MSILEETGHPPALCQGRKHGQSSHRLGGRELALQEQFLRDEAKGDSHSEAGQLEESSVLLGTWHQGKCQQEEKGLSGCGSQRRLFCLSLAKLEFRNHQQPPRGRERKVKKTASGGHEAEQRQGALRTEGRGSLGRGRGHSSLGLAGQVQVIALPWGWGLLHDCQPSGFVRFLQDLGPHTSLTSSYGRRPSSLLSSLSGSM